MKLTRRNFLAWAGLSAVGAVACEGFGIREGEFTLQSPPELPEDLVRGKDNWYTSLCRTCPSCEGIIVRVMEGRAKKIQGNPLYPTNQGKQSARCEATLQAAYHPDRISGPMRRTGPRGSGQYEPIDWPTALDTLRSRVQTAAGRVKLITEPMRGHMGMLAPRFAEAVGGTHMAFEAVDNVTYRTALSNVFGQQIMPDFDLANTDVLLSFGADFLSTWGSPTRYGVGFGEFRRSQGKKRGTLYHVDSRFSMTAAAADRWIPVKPGWEGHLAMSLAYVILRDNMQAPGVDVAALTGGRGAELLSGFRPDAILPILPTASELGEDPVRLVEELAHTFAEAKPGLAIGGGSAGAHSNGLFNLEAIYALNYLVGSVGVPGGVRFNPASPLPDVPASAEESTLANWAKAADDLRNGETNLLLVHGVDPVHGLPGSLGFGDALNSGDLNIISFSPFFDDTTIMADLVLPDRASLEDWGSDIPEPGPGYQTVGFQQPVINPLSDLDPRSFPDILLSIASDLGVQDNLPWNKFEDLLKESGAQLFELGRGSVTAGSAGDFWNKLLAQGGWWDQSSTGPTNVTAPDGLLSSIRGKSAPPQFSGDGSFHLVPFAHNTLLEGRNAHLPWLQAAPDPLSTITWQSWVEMNDDDAAVLGVVEGDLVRVESADGSLQVPVSPTPAVPPRVLSIPMGHGRSSGPDTATGRPGTESQNVMDILAPHQVEGTGAFAWAGTKVRVSRTPGSIKVSKFEGIVRAIEVGILPGERIIQTISPDEL